MAKRLTEQYHPGDPVEILLGVAGWQPGKVVGQQHPGLWVATDSGLWFVTNGRRIRKLTQPPDNST